MVPNSVRKRLRAEKRAAKGQSVGADGKTVVVETAVVDTIAGDAAADSTTTETQTAPKRLGNLFNLRAQQEKEVREDTKVEIIKPQAIGDNVTQVAEPPIIVVSEKHMPKRWMQRLGPRIEAKIENLRIWRMTTSTSSQWTLSRRNRKDSRPKESLTSTSDLLRPLEEASTRSPVCCDKPRTTRSSWRRHTLRIALPKRRVEQSMDFRAKNRDCTTMFTVLYIYCIYLKSDL